MSFHEKVFHGGILFYNSMAFQSETSFCSNHYHYSLLIRQMV
ncbi:hypothetical protein KR50_27210 [Jeotgalibacillus campisalis]|uniref:Uncharacterized protein n=1 Tax=Jeotgalibacillus campisalis TaxID=220754 RepID=A0A0C2VNM9_9BACL|nr:hypothetical protein KR50_27210 [Jeotgalibacillus campisalis]